MSDFLDQFEPGLAAQGAAAALDAQAASATLMVQGTTSDAGKSVLVAALGRVFKRRGVDVVPFKPQNMALNSAVTADGGEIGRAQAVQAQACGLAPSVHMNPVLLKPSSDVGAQVIIQGKALAQMDARHYHEYKQTAMAAVLDSYTRLRQQHRCVLVEGAGSPAEVNLRDRDVANMGFAEAVDCPVIIVADIDRGGVFAHLYGTLALLSPSEQARVKGFVINRFRGDVSLLEPGNRWLERITGKPVLGVLPYLQGLHLEAEDAIASEQRLADTGAKLRVVVPVTPRISNHTDFDPLRLHPEVDLQFVGPDQAMPPADLIVLAGSKAVRDDLAFLRRQGWPERMARHLERGGKVLGICGGYQMLGRLVDDPLGLEGAPGQSAGLGLLDIETELKADKQLRNVCGTLMLPEAAEVWGYEIHAGVTEGVGLAQPFVQLEGCSDGVLTEQVAGTYLHGLFESAAACAAVLRWAGWAEATGLDYRAVQEAGIERLADACETYLDLERIERMLGL